MNPVLKAFLSISLKGQFITELLFAVAMYVTPLERKRHFLLRVISCIIMCYGLSTIWNQELGSILPAVILRYMLLFLLVWLSLIVCFQVNWTQALTVCISAYATQHFVVKIYYFIEIFIDDFSRALKAVVYLAVMIPCYLAVYFLPGRRMTHQQAKLTRSSEVGLLGTGLVFCLVVLGSITRVYEDSTNLWIELTLTLYAMICCIFILGLQFGMFDRSRLETEKREVEHILEQEKRQMEFTKETIDLVNIKMHDLKHFLFRYQENISGAEWEALKSKIEVFDSSVKTGHEILDVVLAEKSLYGERKKVKITCIADGAALSFLPPSDIYSLFGNLLDNAIEAASGMENEDKRYVSMLVKRSMGFVSIHMENFFQGPCRFEHGLPITTKGDWEFHGYGMKSIQMIVEKYHGELQITAEDEVFRINILIPCEL